MRCLCGCFGEEQMFCKALTSFPLNYTPSNLRCILDTEKYMVESGLCYFLELIFSSFYQEGNMAGLTSQSLSLLQ